MLHAKRNLLCAALSAPSSMEFGGSRQIQIIPLSPSYVWCEGVECGRFLSMYRIANINGILSLFWNSGLSRQQEFYFHFI